jgi:hypothetical protein
LRSLRASAAVADATGARNALLDWAGASFTEAPPRSLGALAAMLPASLAAPILELEAHLYGDATGEWDGSSLRDTVDELAAFASRAAARARKDDALEPLYR